jgi:hypothetical protein
MVTNKSIQLKAAFLLIVFSLNTIVGFACAVSIDIEFNSSPHHDDEVTETSMQVHLDEKKHIHQNEATKHHDEAGNDNHKSKDGEDSCCNDKVIQIAKLDKSVPQSLSVINPIIFLTIVSAFYNSEILFSSQVTPSIKYFVQNYHPPIFDIRLAIQSFQI